MPSCSPPLVPWRQAQLAVHEAIVRSTHPAALASPGSVHAALWRSERRLYHACSLLGAASLPTDTLGQLTADLIAISRGCGRGGVPLAQIDARILSVVLDAAWGRATAASKCADDDEAKEAWRATSGVLRRVAVDVDA